MQLTRKGVLGGAGWPDRYYVNSVCVRFYCQGGGGGEGPSQTLPQCGVDVEQVKRNEKVSACLARRRCAA